MPKNKLAFTLLELIIVVTILAILSTIAFLSFNGYSVSARDGARLADLSNMAKAMEVVISKGGALPKPGSSIDIKAGTATVIGYQGYADKSVLGIIGMSDSRDPLDGVYYTYSTNVAQNKYQILGFLESGDSIAFSPVSNVYADSASYIGRVAITKGNSLGILLANTTQAPAQTLSTPIDIVNTTNQYKAILTGTNVSLEGSGGTLRGMSPFASCKNLKEWSYGQKNGMYKIAPNGTQMDVYCDMEHGGYTALFSVDPTGRTWSYNSTEWTNPTEKLSANFFLNETTYQSYSLVKTDSIKICRGDMTKCYEMNHNKGISLKDFFVNNVSYTDFSVFIPNPTYPTNGPDNIGSDKSALFVSSLGFASDYSKAVWFNKYGAGINMNSSNKIGLQGDNNNDWPYFDNYGLGIGVVINWSCGVGNGINNWNTIGNRSIEIGGDTTAGARCAYNTPDTKMWYVFGR